LKIWSAAAASGEEAYSSAMLCSEFQQQHRTFRYQILGTDISRNMLAIAAAGHYAGRSLERLRESQPLLFSRYFSTSGQGACVSEALRENTRFMQHNLLGRLKSTERYDIVFLRNVLIYFDAEHQSRIVRQAGLQMLPHAYLILGESESINHLDTPYVFERPLIYSLGPTASVQKGAAP
jgi:chemotaxis protein methyltransferase CheR